MGTTDHLPRLLASVREATIVPTPAERALLDRLAELARRRAADRFQLAVVGQFKRGKSTLLNALLGMPALPTGVVPLTAVPAIIVYGQEPSLAVELATEVLPVWSGSLEELREKLGALVTETGNPHNEKRVSGVQVALPAPILANGLVLIDTPGIGSAERHNSEAAVAALPHCDGALVVLSPDPPITEAEVDYLKQVRQSAALIVPVLNKMDLVAGEDRAISLSYLEGVLARVGVSEPVLAVSARDGIGLDVLQARLLALEGGERQPLLDSALALKARRLIGDLAFQNDAALALLRTPLDEIEGKLEVLRQGEIFVEREQLIASDLIAGERVRLLDQIDQEAARTREQIVTRLIDAVDVALVSHNKTSAFVDITKRSSELFENAYRTAAERLRERLEAVAARALARLAPVLTGIRAVAAEALDVPFQPPAAELDAGTEINLAWADRAAESMSPLPAGLFDRVLPPALRARRARGRMVREADRLATVNTENLRWTLRQRAEEALRGYDRAIAHQLREAVSATVYIARGVVRLRSDMADLARHEMEERARHAELLANVLVELQDVG